MKEGLKMVGSDLQKAHAQLCEEMSSAYLGWDLGGGRRGYCFVQSGKTLRGFECDSQGQCRLYDSPELWERVTTPVSAGSYLAPTRWLQLVSYGCVLPPLFQEQKVAPKAIRDLLSKWESEKLHGFATLQVGEQRAALAWEAGEMLTDSFVTKYGEFLSSREAIAEFLNRVHQEGGVLSGWGGSKADFEPYLQNLHKQLEQRALLSAKSVSGFFAAKDALKVDSEIAKKWSRSGTFQVVVEDCEGRPLGQAKCSAASGKALSVEVPLKMLQGWGAAEGQKLCLYPA
jgi:hypothetical protein